MIQTTFGKIFGTKNDRELKKYKKRVKLINSLEEKYEALSDDELKAAFETIRAAVVAEEKSLDDVLVDVFLIEACL